MTNPQPHYELRVLAGPQAGASIEVRPGAEVSIGSPDAAKCQIVLRDPLVQAHRIRLRLQEEGRARIKIVHGQVDLDGQLLTGPCAANWPLFAPLKLGDTVIALGIAKSAEWKALSQRFLPVPVGEAPQSGPESVWPGDEPQLPVPVVAAKPRRFVPEAWIAAVGGAVAMVTAAVLGLVSITSSAQHSGVSSERDRYAMVLNRDEFRGLRMEEKAGKMVLSGDLASRAARTQLEKGLAAAGLVPLIDVRVAEDMASSVAEVFRMHGVAAEVKPSLQNPGQLEVRTSEANETKLKQAEAAARRDVPGALQMQVSNTVPRVPPTAHELPYDAQKRIAAIVTGEVPYLVTADGTRYFIGATLPSGHRVESITDQQVLLSRDGMSSPLRF